MRGGVGPDLALEHSDVHRSAKDACRSVQASGAAVATLGGSEPGGDLEAVRRSIVVAALPQELEALVQQAPRRFVVVFFERHEREARERAQDSPRVVEAAEDGEALLE